MKKVLAIILSIVCLGTIFVACSKIPNEMDVAATSNRNINNSGELKFFICGKAVNFPIRVGEFCDITSGKFVIKPNDAEEIKTLEAFHGYIVHKDKNESDCFDEYGYIKTGEDVIEVDCVRSRNADDSFDMSSSFEDCLIIDIKSDYYAQEDDIEYINNWKYKDGVWGYDYSYNFENHHKDIYRSVLGIGRNDTFGQLLSLRVCDRILGRNDLKSIFSNLTSDYDAADSFSNIKHETISIIEGNYEITLEVVYIPEDVDGDGFITIGDKTGEIGSLEFVYDNEAIKNGTADAILSEIHIHYSGEF